MVSVEMFEQMRNGPRLLERIDHGRRRGQRSSTSLTHRKFAYVYETGGETTCMGAIFHRWHHAPRTIGFFAFRAA